MFWRVIMRLADGQKLGTMNQRSSIHVTGGTEHRRKPPRFGRRGVIPNGEAQ